MRELFGIKTVAFYKICTRTQVYMIRQMFNHRGNKSSAGNGFSSSRTKQELWSFQRRRKNERYSFNYLSLVAFFRISLECLSCQRWRRPTFCIVTAFSLQFASCTARRSNRDRSTSFVWKIVHVVVMSCLIVFSYSDIPSIIYRSIFQFAFACVPLALPTGNHYCNSER